MKATAIACSNIALIKYWGKLDEKLNLPMNNSISMNLDNAKTTTTVEFSKDYPEDIVKIDGKLVNEKEKIKVVKHLDRIREIAKINLKAKVVSENSFPKETGIASSASGFAALSLAGTLAAGIELNEKELSILARLGSGSACRSIPGGYVEWKAAKKSEDSYAVQIAPPEYLDLRDIVTIVSKARKEVSSSEGHRRARSSPFYQARLAELKKSIPEMRNAIREKDISKIGKLAEKDAISMHTIMMTSEPPIFYWLPETIKIIHEILSWRSEGLEAYFTIDAGPSVHVLTFPENVKEVEKRLKNLGVISTIHNKPGKEIKIINKHLF